MLNKPNIIGYKTKISLNMQYNMQYKLMYLIFL